MASPAPAGPRDLVADVPYFNVDAPPEVFKDGVLILGETPGISKEEFKRRRQLSTVKKPLPMRDARTALPGGLEAFRLDTHGFCAVPAPSPAVDFADRERVKAEHYPQILDTVKKVTGATHAFYMQNFQTRTENPLNLSIAYARFGHCDGGPEMMPEIRQLLAAKHLIPEAEASTCDIVMAGLWHPIDRPAFKDPLCLLDFSSVRWQDEVIRYVYVVSEANKVADTRSQEQIAADAANRFKESAKRQGAAVQAPPAPPRAAVTTGYPQGVPAIGPVYAPTHRWYYCSDMGTDQMWLWKNWDTREGVAKCAFHNSFHDPFYDNDPTVPGRRNVEHRLILTFPKKEGEKISRPTDPDWVPTLKVPTTTSKL